MEDWSDWDMDRLGEIGSAILVAIVCVCICAGFVSLACADPPPPGWSTQCRIVEVYDGDTITVEITRRVRVRLINCWADEIRTKDPEEKRRGLAARDALRDIAEGQEAVLFVPSNSSERSGDEWSMSRVLGHVWVDGKSLAEQQIENGHATSTKGGRPGE